VSARSIAAKEMTMTNQEHQRMKRLRACLRRILKTLNKETA